MDISQIIFLIVAAVTLISAVMVVTTRNLVHGALWLIVTLFAVAVVFVLLEAGFIAVVQVVLYIGAIAILIIFAMMLTRRALSDEPHQTNSQWPISAMVAVAVFAALTGLVSFLPGWQWPSLPSADLSLSLRQLGYALVQPNQFALPFEVASVLLIVALIGAVAVAGEKK
jgi:NADH-quinone oxidoreductase subunit J